MYAGARGEEVLQPPYWLIEREMETDKNVSGGAHHFL